MNRKNSKRRTFAAWAIATLALTALAADARAVNIFSNPITTAVQTQNPYTAEQTFDPNITVSGIGHGSGVTPNTATGGSRYNMQGWAASLDANDYYTFTLTPNAGYQIDFTNLAGQWQRSNTGPTSYILKSSFDAFDGTLASGTIVNGAGNYSLDLSTLQDVATSIEFRLYAFGNGAAAGTFSFNDFTFDGLVEPTTTGGGNNSVITAASSNLGRVMLNQTASGNISLTKTGSNETTYTAAASNDGITVSPLSDSVAAGPQSPNVSVQLENNANGSQTTGAKAYTVTIDNTAADSGGAGQGSADPDDVVNVSATVVDNRTVGGTISGNVIRSVPIATPVTTTGDNNHFTHVTVNGDAATDGTVSVAAGSATVFDDAADTASRGVTFSTVGAQTGSVTLGSAGEGLTGETPNPVAITYNTTVYDPSQAKFLSNNDTTLTLDLGSFAAGSGSHSIGQSIYSVLQTVGLTAELDFDTIMGTGDTSILSTDLTNGAFTALAAGVANAFAFNAIFDANHAAGDYDATYTLNLSDANSYAGATSQLLTLNLSGTITGVGPALPGDYNGNNVVDASDYVLWRKSLATGALLPNNDVTPATTAAEDYDVWRANFGNVGTPGSGAGLSGSGTAVPEPSVMTLLLVSLITLGTGALTPKKRASSTVNFTT
jgi:hypothetical protein